MKKALLEKWEHADLWRLDEFATLCCGYDPEDDLSNDRPETYYKDRNAIREQIRRAVISGSLPATPEPNKSLADSTYGFDLYVNPTHAVEWASHRFSAFPKFSKYIVNFTPGQKIQLATDELEKNTYWLSLRKKAQEAIRTYPAWGKRQHKVQKTGNLIDWLRGEHNLNGREAEIVKNILTEHFDL